MKHELGYLIIYTTAAFILRTYRAVASYAGRPCKDRPRRDCRRPVDLKNKVRSAV